jgi:hypothetical protein
MPNGVEDGVTKIGVGCANCGRDVVAECLDHGLDLTYRDANSGLCG